MQLSSTFKILSSLAAIIGAEYIVHVETSPSNFQLATSNLGLHNTQSQALLTMFQIPGYLSPQNLWNDIHRSKSFNDPKAVFSMVSKNINNYGNDTELLSKHLFGRSAHYFWEQEDITNKQVQDWILYVAQNAFNRKTGQERSELQSFEWMKASKDQYMDAATKLGIINGVAPEQKEYDACWIAGASRPGFLARSAYLKELLDQGLKINNKIQVLAGERPLWAEIDGINPHLLQAIMHAIETKSSINAIKTTVPSIAPQESINEGAQYMIELAHKLNIPLVEQQPIIKYSSKESCPKGLFPGRTYANYYNPNGPKLDESAMAKDIVQTVFKYNNIDIIDTKSEGEQRPTTATTAKDAARELAAHLIHDKPHQSIVYHVLFVTNQPYITRQTLSAQKAVDEVLFDNDVKIILHGVGFDAKQDISVVHSEMGAFVHELWKTANPNEIDTHLLFQTRDNSSTVPPIGEDIAHNDA